MVGVAREEELMSQREQIEALREEIVSLREKVAALTEAMLQLAVNQPVQYVPYRVVPYTPPANPWPWQPQTVPYITWTVGTQTRRLYRTHKALSTAIPAEL